MLVKLLQRMASPAGNYSAGTVIELDGLVLEQMIAGGYAVSLEPEVKVITEVIDKNVSVKRVNKSPAKVRS